MQTLAVKPAVASAGKVHRQIDMSAQGLKTGAVEPSDRTHVSGYRPDRQVFVAAGDGLSDYPPDKESPYASAPETISDDDRFDLPAGAAIKQARQADYRTFEIGDPRCHSFWCGEIVVERTAGIVASDRRIFVYLSMMLSQFHPQHLAGGIVSRRVVADDDAGRRCRARQLAALHGDRLPVPRSIRGPAENLLEFGCCAGRGLMA